MVITTIRQVDAIADIASAPMADPPSLAAAETTQVIQIRYI